MKNWNSFRSPEFCRQALFSPYDFGFIPNTRGGDGDPLDVLVVMDEPAFVGCLVSCRLLGLIEAKQTEKGKTERERSVNCCRNRLTRPRKFEVGSGNLTRCYWTRLSTSSFLVTKRKKKNSDPCGDSVQWRQESQSRAQKNSGLFRMWPC